MKTAPGALVSFLLSKQPCQIADLFTFSLINGNTYYWTTYDQSLVSNGITYSTVCSGPGATPPITRSSWNVKNTIDVPSMDIAILSDGTDFNDGQNVKLLAHNGLFDGAYVQLNRVWMPTPGDTSLGAPLLFGGRVSVVQIGAKGIKMTVKGDNLLMQQYIPRNVFNYNCILRLYSPSCGADAASFTTAHVAGGGSNAIFLDWQASPPGTPTNYTLGYVTIISGAAAGEIRTIGGASNDGVAMTYPLFETVAPGDTFTATFGCDKRFVTCGVFGRQQSYRGFEFIPPAEIGI